MHWLFEENWSFRVLQEISFSSGKLVKLFCLWYIILYILDFSIFHMKAVIFLTT